MGVVTGDTGAAVVVDGAGRHIDRYLAAAAAPAAATAAAVAVLGSAAWDTYHTACAQFLNAYTWYLTEKITIRALADIFPVVQKPRDSTGSGKIP